MSQESLEPSPLNIDELRNEIAVLESLDLDEFSVECIKNRLARVICGQTVLAPRIQANRHLFRVVPWDEPPGNYRQISYPPPERVTSLGRVNREGQSIFYCSNSPAAALLEVGARPGKTYAIAVWNTREKFLVNHVGYTKEVYTHLRGSQDIPDWVPTEESNWCDQRELLVGRFLHDQFTKKVPPGYEYLYKMSIAIAERHFEDELFDGLMYPTIAAAARADNLALKPTCVDSRLDFVQARFARVEDVAEEKVHLTILDVAKSLSGKGDINWLGGTCRWVLRKGGERLLFSAENGQWVARDDTGRVVEPELGSCSEDLELPKWGDPPG